MTWAFSSRDSSSRTRGRSIPRRIRAGKPSAWRPTLRCPQTRRSPLKKLEEKASDEGAKAALAWARAGLESEIAPYAPPAKALKEYVGTFGPRKFFIEGSKLVYQREERPKVALVPMSKDLFALEGVEYFRVRFTRNASGAVDAVVGMYDNGREERNPKGK
jgi:hypothetical protein